MGFDLTARTAVVTGAGRGIGEEIALSFADAGADLVVTARTESEIENTAEAARSCGVKAVAVPTDLGDEAQIDALFEHPRAELGTPDVLVNNAAANLANDPLEQTLEETQTMLDVNLRAAFTCSQRFARGVIDDESVDDARIIGISSVVAHVGVPAMSLYGATKAGLIGLSRSLAVALGEHGITVNTVSPGMTRVKRIDRLLEEKGDLYDLDRIPLDRLAEPADIASACCFLASDHASYVTGEDLTVDGGVKATAGLYP
ncbi:SDR family NAD(P)-dependent oxidoreductase [Natronosalvus caseinilyticus]|uniref:SDR family NAD(P)-dependent oxidoreductase n=1 Tax=Natronosalvus caseinilyticus TaxID=2953747 RepID=UPI0028AEDFD9|nr:SDR family oxidoreductase [Natronosalvus caseinilyticus]